MSEFLITWVFTIALGIGLFIVAGPRIPGLGPEVERARKGILFSGFLPCFGFQIVGPLMFYAVYRHLSKAGREGAKIADRITQTGLSSPSPSQASSEGPGAAKRDNPFLKDR